MFVLKFNVGDKVEGWLGQRLLTQGYTLAALELASNSTVNPPQTYKFIDGHVRYFSKHNGWCVSVLHRSVTRWLVVATPESVAH